MLDGKDDSVETVLEYDASKVHANAIPNDLKIVFVKTESLRECNPSVSSMLSIAQTSHGPAATSKVGRRMLQSHHHPMRQSKKHAVG